MSDNDIIIPEKISADLKTKIIGKKIIYFPETDSTNTRAKQFAIDNCLEGTVILADSQTMGRGRMDRMWHSPVGTGIYMSIIVHPGISIKELPKITLVAAVAAAEALSASANVNIIIKWPNDLLLNDKKICGILTELHSLGNEKSFVIVGIGINVNTPGEMFPADIAGIATSILKEAGQKIPRSAIIKSVIECFDRWYGVFLNGAFPEILHKWKAYSKIIGRRIQVKEADTQITGTVIDIGSDGALMLEDANGCIYKIYSGDISYL
jgi:BirA family transcriptional regulator, biotin operon repressor / biotin---[acetyl-CoA-carboxylase] ligase